MFQDHTPNKLFLISSLKWNKCVFLPFCFIKSTFVCVFSLLALFTRDVILCLHSREMMRLVLRRARTQSGSIVCKILIWHTHQTQRWSDTFVVVQSNDWCAAWQTDVWHWHTHIHKHQLSWAKQESLFLSNIARLVSFHFFLHRSS